MPARPDPDHRMSPNGCRDRGTYLSVAEFCALNGIPRTAAELEADDRELEALCRAKGIEIKTRLVPL